MECRFWVNNSPVFGSGEDIFLEKTTKIYISVLEFGDPTDHLAIYKNYGEEYTHRPFSFSNPLQKFKFLNSFISSGLAPLVRNLPSKLFLIRVLSALSLEFKYSTRICGICVLHFEKYNMKTTFSFFPPKCFVTFWFGKKRTFTVLDNFEQKVDECLDLIRKKSGWYLEREIQTIRDFKKDENSSNRGYLLFVVKIIFGAFLK